MRTTVLSLAALCLLAFVPACTKPVSPATEQFKKGMELKSAQRYQEALQLFQKAVELDPNFADAYLEAAMIYDDMLEDKAGAISWYQRYLDISANERQKEIVRRWMGLAREAMQASAATATGQVIMLTGPAREAVTAIVSKERDQLKSDFSAKEKELIAKNEAELARVRDELRKFKAENRDLQDKVENLTVDRDSLKQKLDEGRSRKDLTELLASPELRGSDKQLQQSLMQMKTQVEQARAQYQQETTKARGLEESLVKLKQELAAANKAMQSGVADKELAAQITALRDENRALNTKISSLEKSARIGEALQPAADIEAKDAEIKRLQERIAQLDKDKSEAEAGRERVETALADLKKRTDEVIAASPSPAEKESLAEENRRLRMQIAKITTDYNENSAKRTEAEQRVNELERQVETLKTLPASAKPAVGREFTDLSEEIMQMQETIKKQNQLLMQRDAQIASLTDQNLKFQQSAPAAQTPAPSSTLVAELNRSLDSKERQIGLLEKQLSAARASAAAEPERLKTDELEKELDKARTRIAELEKQSGAPAVDIGQPVSVAQTASVAPAQQTEVDITPGASPQPVPAQRSGSQDTWSQYTTTWKPELEPPRQVGAAGAAVSTQPRTAGAQTVVTPASSYRRPAPSAYSVTPSSGTTTGGRTVRAYRVQQGDTLSGIAQKVYGDRTKWTVIFQYNRDTLQRANALRVGQVLYIPPQ